jgi:hypothetical protein
VLLLTLEYKKVYSLHEKKSLAKYTTSDCNENDVEAKTYKAVNSCCKVCYKMKINQKSKQCQRDAFVLYFIVL